MLRLIINRFNKRLEATLTIAPGAEFIDRPCPSANLEARGVRCYAATTRRDAITEDDEKRSRFTFVTFRPLREA